MIENKTKPLILSTSSNLDIIALNVAAETFMVSIDTLGVSAGHRTSN
jgi:hypothetical protein